VASRSTSSFATAPARSAIYTLSLHDALPILAEPDSVRTRRLEPVEADAAGTARDPERSRALAVAGAVATGVHEQRRLREELPARSEEHTSELQSRGHLVCRLLLEKKKRNNS